MLNLINKAGRKQKLALVGLLVVVVAGLTLSGIVSAEVACPPGYEMVPSNSFPYFACVKIGEAEDATCDYGRNPEQLWPDNPDGHPFERAFCDGNTEVQYKHPLDTPENEGLYCDEVPGCWAYGLN